jgi:hypothetical protein
LYRSVENVSQLPISVAGFSDGSRAPEISPILVEPDLSRLGIIGTEAGCGSRIISKLTGKLAVAFVGSFETGCCKTCLAGTTPSPNRLRKSRTNDGSANSNARMVQAGHY